MWSTATPYQQQVPRLGDLMLQRHQLDSRQLALAVMVQRREPHRPLGEILIQLGFVSAKQLNRNLRWQRYLRCASVALAFTLTPFHLCNAADKGEVDTRIQPFYHTEHDGDGFVYGGQADGEAASEAAGSGINLLSYSSNKLTTFLDSQAGTKNKEVSFDEGGLKYTADLNFEGITLGVSFSF